MNLQDRLCEKSGMRIVIARLGDVGHCPGVHAGFAYGIQVIRPRGETGGGEPIGRLAGLPWAGGTKGWSVVNASAFLMIDSVVLSSEPLL